ncbi:hypothetical protein AVEN_103127-1 [Araneus ventricosus]|uniref:Uncharacterized protein n=1 Tax=Araneus ventricosus TaxID=182803 RepID=A0A4Y2K3Z4_ARAVE|nr:hypothetical protein AVEN_103127-1 [Araneus ventricosus]
MKLVYSMNHTERKRVDKDIWALWVSDVLWLNGCLGLSVLKWLNMLQRIRIYESAYLSDTNAHRMRFWLRLCLGYLSKDPSKANKCFLSCSFQENMIEQE